MTWSGMRTNVGAVRPAVVCCTLLVLGAARAEAQVTIGGRVLHPRSPGSEQVLPLTGILVAASLDGGAAQALSFRTWETEPVGWYRLSGPAGRYTLCYGLPAHFMRPVVLTNVFAAPGAKIERVVTPRFDFANFDEGQWDRAAGSQYYQTFVARGTSLTQVGFRLAHDGVDGAGPSSQTLLVSVHRRAPGTPDRWPQIGPSVPVVEVDSGGPKNYLWSAGWNSGAVPLEPGQTYAVQLRGERAGARFQPFWRADDDAAADCFRVGPEGAGFARHDLWLAVSSDGDGLVIPYNKRVHRQFNELTQCLPRWTQTYVARGRSLAAVTLYAAVSGAQPPLARQRVRVSVRRGGPQGEVVGVRKIAVGNGNYTGDASWGAFLAAYSPGEVPLEPGATYALDFESIENYATLHGFVNIKGQVSDDRPGFNPYRKHPRDGDQPGAAFAHGSQERPFDLDLQVIEYEHELPDWQAAVDQQNLLDNGDFERRAEEDHPQPGRAAAWQTFSRDPGTVHAWPTDPPEGVNHLLRVAAAPAAPHTADGGFVQRVSGLSPAQTYRLSGRVRSTWPLDDARHCQVGFDPTGQTDDPAAGSIQWAMLPGLHGRFEPYTSPPIRPQSGAISVWLRGRSTQAGDTEFQADFDDFALRRVLTLPSEREQRADEPAGVRGIGSP